MSANPLSFSEDNNTLKARALRYLQLNERKRYTGTELSVILDHGNVSAMQSTLGTGWKSCTEGWEFVHRTRSRPMEYWFDSSVERFTGANLEVVENDIMRITGHVGPDARMLIDPVDKSPWFARRFRINENGQVQL